jgi:hypothetical protein
VLKIIVSYFQKFFQRFQISFCYATLELTTQKIESINFTVTPYINEYPTLYCPTNAHNVKNLDLLKHFKIKEAAPKCFCLQGNHHQGTTDST